jgi:hypothetical protein
MLKIVSNLELGLRRLREYSYPLEDARMKAAGHPGTSGGPSARARASPGTPAR